jgi:hypothetical protein
MKTPCKHCGKSLVAVGRRRANGKAHEDWESRQYHKKCWTLIKKHEEKIIDLDQQERDDAMFIEALMKRMRSIPT